MTARKLLVPAAGFLMLGSLLTVGQQPEPAAAVKRETVCKPASGRAMVYEGGRAIGYLFLQLTFCWEVLGSQPTRMLGAKVNQVKVKMPPDETKECLLVRKFGDYFARPSSERINSQRWRITATGDYRTRIYTDTAPRDCKHKYLGTKVWRPVVTIDVGVGGKVQVTAPPVS